MTLFWILAVLTIPAALMVILHRNPVYSALALVFTLFQVAIMFVALDAPVIAFLQVIVYAGAIMVLILFAIMLLSLQPEEPKAGGRMRGVASAIGIRLAVELAAVVVLDMDDRWTE